MHGSNLFHLSLLKPRVSTRSPRLSLLNLSPMRIMIYIIDSIVLIYSFDQSKSMRSKQDKPIDI
jgi:hypothetical protein